MRISITVTEKEDKSKIEFESDVEAVKPLLIIIKKMIIEAIGVRANFVKSYIDVAYNYALNKLLDGVSFHIKTKNGHIPLVFRTKEITTTYYEVEEQTEGGHNDD